MKSQSLREIVVYFIKFYYFSFNVKGGKKVHENY